MISYGEAVEAIKFENSESRLDMLLSLAGRMDRTEWLRLLGEEWSVCDNISDFRLELRRLLGTNGPINEMMTPEERDVYRNLPESITCYRGCGPHNMIGASWTLERETAREFPFLNRYQVGQPLLVTARVRRSNILALKMDREEHELITFNARRIAVEPITDFDMEALRQKRHAEHEQSLRSCGVAAD